VAIATENFFAEGYCILATPGTAHTLLILVAASTRFPWGVWLPYLTGAVILAIGLEDFAQKQGLDKLVALGPVFIAVPIAIFGTEHFTAAQIVSGMVPAWIPSHMFWALLVGTCLIAAALSIAAGKQASLAAAMLGLMIVLFVFLIHIPNIAAAPHNRILWVVGLRDLAFAGGAFALSAMRKEAWTPRARRRLVTLARLSVAVAITVCGIEQFLYPELAPGVPLEKSTPLWIPAHLLWSYLTGAVFVVTGISMLINRRVRLAATAAGLMALLLVIIVYVPIVVSNPSDIGNGLNYLADTLFVCGSLLALAETQRESLPLAYQTSESKPVEAKAG
jgi:uncharacterized membrane protein